MLCVMKEISPKKRFVPMLYTTANPRLMSTTSGSTHEFIVKLRTISASTMAIVM